MLNFINIPMFTMLKHANSGQLERLLHLLNKSSQENLPWQFKNRIVVIVMISK